MMRLIFISLPKLKSELLHGYEMNSSRIFENSSKQFHLLGKPFRKFFLNKIKYFNQKTNFKIMKFIFWYSLDLKLQDFFVISVKALRNSETAIVASAQKVLFTSFERISKQNIFCRGIFYCKSIHNMFSWELSQNSRKLFSGTPLDACF